MTDELDGYYFEMFLHFNDATDGYVHNIFISIILPIGFCIFMIIRLKRKMIKIKIELKNGCSNMNLAFSK